MSKNYVKFAYSSVVVFLPALMVAPFLFAVALQSCGKSLRQPREYPIGSVDIGTVTFGQARGDNPLAGVSFPSTLPTDGVQPWEKVDGEGHVVSSETGAMAVQPLGVSDGMDTLRSRIYRTSSAIDLETDFTPGVEKFNSAGDVTDFQEASRFASGNVGEKQVSYALYRISLGPAQPGTISADVNLRLRNDATMSDYYLGVSDYRNNVWEWFGPFNDPHVRIPIAVGDYTSDLGSTFIAVVAYDGASFDVVGIGVNVRNDSDTTPPPSPSALSATGHVESVSLEWTPSVAGDLAGYRIYMGAYEFASASDDGVESLSYLVGRTSHRISKSIIQNIRARSADPNGPYYFGVTAVDVSGNESPLSEVASASLIDGSPTVLLLSTDTVSGTRGLTANLTATGAEVYDWDTEGDGVFDITGDFGGSQTIIFNEPGIIRPAVRGTTAAGGESFAAVSLIVTSNSRPVVSGSVEPTSGVAPLDVQFTAVAEDSEGSELTFAWDFDGDGIYDSTQQSPPFTYSIPKLYNAKVRVSDIEGDWDVDTVSVLVNANPEIQVPIINSVTAEPSLTVPGTVIQFSVDADVPFGDIVSYSWDFDNNGTEDSNLQNPQYFYSSEGLYNAKVRVTGDLGGYAVGYVTVRVEAPVNAPPVAILTGYPRVSFLGEGDSVLVTLNAGQSYDPDGTIDIYYFDPEGDGSFVFNGTNPVFTFTYYASGDYLPALSVVDDDGRQTRTNISVKVYRFSEEIPDTGSGNDVGQNSSLDIVAGNPAISYYDSSNGDLWFARAEDPTGTRWSAPILVDSGGANDVGRYSSLEVVNGNPAISYYDATGDSLAYVRALDAEGSTWGTPVVNIGGGGGMHTSLAVISGNPAIAWYDQNNQDLLFIRAIDADGSDWGSSQSFPDPDVIVGRRVTLLTVNGNPAIAYANPVDSMGYYVRATDSLGGAWGARVPISDLVVDGHIAMAVVNGRPAIAFHPGAELGYVRAVDANGTSWGTPVILDSAGDVGHELSMAIINGVPAISYEKDFDTTGDIKFVMAKDADGTNWWNPVFVAEGAKGGGGTNTSLIELLGRPAISFYDGVNGDLVFAFPRIVWE